MTPEYFNAILKTIKSLGLRQLIELSLMGVEAAHEPVFGCARRRLIIAMVVTVQGKFIALGHAAIQQALKIAVGSQGVAMMEVRHHQPCDWHGAQGIDGFDKGPIIGPVVRRHIVQHQ